MLAGGGFIFLGFTDPRDGAEWIFFGSHGGILADVRDHFDLPTSPRTFYSRAQVEAYGFPYPRDAERAGCASYLVGRLVNGVPTEDGGGIH